MGAQVSEPPQYWVIAPYDSNKLWNGVWQFDLQHGVISIGWQALGDVSALSEERLKELIKITYPDKTNRQRDYLHDTLRKFYHSINVGDVVVASNGRSKLAGIGTVTRRAYYAHRKNQEASDPEHAHSNYLDVKWENTPRDKKFTAYVFQRRTLSRIDEEKFQALLVKTGSVPINIADPIEGDTDTAEHELPSFEMNPTPTIGALVPVGRELVSVSRHTPIRDAVHKMMHPQILPTTCHAW